MKIFTLLSCVSSAFAAISGDLTVSFADSVVMIKGDLKGLPAGTTDGGIHVHTGIECTNGGKTTAAELKAHIGGHQMSNSFDGWLYPSPTAYTTTDTGGAVINVKATSYKLATTDATDDIPAVEGRCIVLHGLSADDTKSRVAIGKIVKVGTEYTATIGKYPGPNDLATTPAGKLTVSIDTEGQLVLSGTLTGLAKKLEKLGIHVHTGTDCTGGSDVTTKTLVNGVVGGHLLTKGDGFMSTKYSSDADGNGNINIATPKGSYTLRTKDGTAAVPAVEKHCIVIHSATGSRVGIGQIVCTDTSCKASMGKYPVPQVPATGTTQKATQKATTKKKDETSTATNIFLTMSVLAVACIGSVF